MVQKVILLTPAPGDLDGRDSRAVTFQKPS